MPRSRKLMTLGVAVLTLMTTVGVSHADSRTDGDESWFETAEGARLHMRSDPFVGSDGQSHEPAPGVVAGRKDELFAGADFDIACLHDVRLEGGIRAIDKVARIIRASGRQVVFTVAPNKTQVYPHAIRRQRMPHGKCGAQGLERQGQVLDDYDSPHYVPLRQPLRRHKEHRTFWKTDSHWTTAGGAVVSREIAAALDPRLARLQRPRYGKLEIWGLFNQFLGDPTTEVADAAKPGRRMRVRPVGDDPGWNSVEQVITDHKWKTSPANRTWPGRTVVIGDSFTLFALHTLRPLFRRGRFLWIGPTPTSTMVQQIKQADTVVIEVAQFLVMSSPLGKPEFRREVRRALG
jgi:hypothetical protein